MIATSKADRQFHQVLAKALGITVRELYQQTGEPIPEYKPLNRVRGFAHLSPERRSQIAQKGGRTAHAQGVAHEWTSATAPKRGSAKETVNVGCKSVV